jgi:SOS response regulatory protein OraA/RecX
MESNLLKKGFSEDVVEITLEKLKSYGYWMTKHMQRSCEAEVENKGLGKRSAAGKLYRSGIDRETADAALCAVDDETERENASHG